MSIETLDLEDVRPDEVLVRVVATGICHTDVAMRDGVYPVPQPIVLGHEGSGVVEKVGSKVSKVSAGDHVVMTFNSCGTCHSCRDHAPSYCHDFFGSNFAGKRADGTSALSKQGEVIHGHFFGQSSFATYSVCSERNVIKVPKTLPLESLGPLACGIQTGAGSVINVFRPTPGQSIAVFGAGSVGMAAIMAAAACGLTTIIAVDLSDERLTLAQDLGATHTINARRSDNVAQEISRLTGGGVNFAFDTTARPEVLRAAVEALAIRGVCGYVGAAPFGTEVALNFPEMMAHGKTLRGIIEGDSVPDVFIPKLIDMHRAGLFPFDRLIRYYSFEEINRAMDDSESGAVLKPVVRFSA